MEPELSHTVCPSAYYSMSYDISSFNIALFVMTALRTTHGSETPLAHRASGLMIAFGVLPTTCPPRAPTGQKCRLILRLQIS